VSVRLFVDDTLHVRQMLVDILPITGSRSSARPPKARKRWPGRPNPIRTWW
jgi:hypothetical protein